MAVYNIMPTENIKIEDVVDTLRNNGGSIPGSLTNGYKFSDIFNMSAKINMWSKHKPVQLNISDSQDHNSSKPNYNPTWWRGENGKCGLGFPIYIGIGSMSSGFIYDLKNKGFSWDYEIPTGGTYPFRLTDFSRYYSKAINPIVPMSVYNVFPAQDGSIQIDLDMAVQPNDPHNLSLHDISAQGTIVANFYLGVLLFRGTTYHLVTSDTNINSGGYSIKISDMASAIGTWTGAFFLSSVRIASGGSVSSGKFIPLNIDQSTVNIKSQSQLYSVTAFGSWNYNNSQVDFEVYMENKSSSAITFTNTKVVLVRTTGSQSPENGEVIYTENIGNIFVLAGNTTQYGPYSIRHIKGSGYTYWLGGYAQSITATYFQIEDYS